MSERLLKWREIEWAYTKWCEGYTHEQIADALYVSLATIKRAIGGRPRIRPILKYEEQERRRERMTLYELTEELMELLAMAEDEDVDPQILQDTFEGVEGEFDAKVEAYCKVIKGLMADMEVLKAEEERIAKKRKTIENNVTSMKDTIELALRTVGKTKAGGKLFTASIQKNGGKAPLVVTLQPEELPEEYRKVEYKQDSDAIRKALEEGKELQWACLTERGESLRIR